MVTRICRANRRYGLQLYTLFNVVDSDVQGTLKKVAGIGYKKMESAFSKKGGYYGVKPKEFAIMVKDLGMSWKAHHVLGAPFKLPPGAKMPAGADGKPITIPPMRNLRENMQQLVDEAAEGGVEYLVCASTPVETSDELKSSIDTVNKTAEAAKKAGLIMAYHNHDREFKKVDEKVPYDLLLSETNPDAFKMELDLCWVTKAGVDPVELFKKNPGRFQLWHLKDIDKDMKGPQPVGTGVVDFKRIFANAEVAGMKHFFVEHDMPADPIASITTSYNNLQKIMS
ncbi:MAG TPA: sugar phosphate isomerase/epimerase [Segetibacter sp.]|nr:sugar phosphate isomerase/epimerase [Segetibacter sp.]